MVELAWQTPTAYVDSGPHGGIVQTQVYPSVTPFLIKFVPHATGILPLLQGEPWAETYSLE